jgi:hypothetical protein
MLVHMMTRSRGKSIIAILILIMAMLLLAIFGIAQMLHVDPTASGPAYDLVRWLESMMSPYLAVIQEWLEFFVRKFAELRIPGIS